MIGVIGYGMVGKAVVNAFTKTNLIISDPQYNNTTITEMCASNPEAIFVCVPTPSDDTNYLILKDVLQQLQNNYGGLVVVKSTILPNHLDGFDVIYNPEFLSRSTSYEDFINPHILVIGGEKEKANKLLEIYKNYSIVQMQNAFLTDIKTASLIKYTLNTFFALKVTFMNNIYDIANKMDVDYNEMKNIISNHPWIGNQHIAVPGPDGHRGFGGPCLPKDTEAFSKEFDVKLLKVILDMNREYRDGN